MSIYDLCSTNLQLILSLQKGEETSGSQRNWNAGDQELPWVPWTVHQSTEMQSYPSAFAAHFWKSYHHDSKK